MTVGDYHNAAMWEQLAATRPGLVVISTPCQRAVDSSRPP